ncbi:remorin 1.4-like [Pyrus x bretschneideri]|uniref:remorin 1.4-like n=1 Tax=Pyrus x bretschneideri TaxID=225117 RepID=UPI000510CBF0|nr:remorin 1.4-like [Pyrus x bretschneideri]
MASPAPTPPEKEKATPAIVEKDAGAIRKVLSTKSLGLIKAWEEREKTKVDNRANKKLSNVVAWELSKQAAIDARQKKYEQKLEKKKALYVEKMQNKIAGIHKTAEEKKAMVEEAKRIERNKVGEKADDFREIGHVPKKILSCFNC